MNTLRSELPPRASSSMLPNSQSPSPPTAPTNDDIEAVIKMATSTRPSPDGRPGPGKDTRTQLFVGNLPYRVRWQDLKDLFRKSGTVLRADVSLGPDNRSRGYGTVLLATAEDAGRAVDMFNGYSWQTRTLEVRLDRLPPDFDNPTNSNGMGMLSTMPVGAPGGSNGGLQNGFTVSSPLHAMQLSQPQSQLGPSANPSIFSLPPVGSTIDDALEYAGLLGRDQPRSSSTLGRNLFVGNLPFHCQWQDLKDLFRQAGTILRADVSLGPDGRSRGFGTVSFANEVDAERAVNIFNGFDYNGRTLKVHYDKFSQMPQPSNSTSPQPSSHESAYSGHHNEFGAFMPHPLRVSFDFGQASSPASSFNIYAPGRGHSQPIQQVKDNSPPMDSSSSGDSLCVNLSIGASPSSPTLTATQASPTSPRAHPAHPGPISLPPPVSAFPIPPPHTLSPNAMTPRNHPLSPLHHPNHAHVVAMTPHGLPPITPSMPPFTFLPQDSPMQHPNSSQGVSSPMMHPAHRMFGPFSPGMTMSPGAFWGRPGPGHAVNPFLNPAVGSPVLMHQSGGPVSPGEFFSMQPHQQEPSGYFPPVTSNQPEADYFPPVTEHSGLANEILREPYGDREEDRERSNSGSGRSDASTDLGLKDKDMQSSRATSWGTNEEAIEDATRKLTEMHVGKEWKPSNMTSDVSNDQSQSRMHSRSVGANAPPQPPTLLHKTHSDQTGFPQRTKSTTPSSDILGAPPMGASPDNSSVLSLAQDSSEGDSDLDPVISAAARRASWGMEFAEQRRQSALKGIGLGFKNDFQ